MSVLAHVDHAHRVSPQENCSSIEQGIELLRARFPVFEKVSVNHALFARIRSGQASLPHGADCWIVLPPWKLIAPAYGEATIEMLIALGVKECNFGEVKQKLHQTAKKTRAMEYLSRIQGSGFVLAPGHFGSRIARVTPRRARVMMNGNFSFGGSEIGMGVWELGALKIAYPDHMPSFGMYCAGDKYASSDYVPSLEQSRQGFVFCSRWIDYPRSMHCSPSFFISDRHWSVFGYMRFVVYIPVRVLSILKGAHGRPFSFLT